MDDQVRCTAHNREGQRCGKARRLYMTVCATHGGSAPQTIAAARRRAAAAADALMGSLLDLAFDTDTPAAVRRQAITDALDRVGLTRGVRVEVEDSMTAEVRQLAEQLGVTDHPQVAALLSEDDD